MKRVFLLIMFGVLFISIGAISNFLLEYDITINVIHQGPNVSSEDNIFEENYSRDIDLKQKILENFDSLA